MSSWTWTSNTLQTWQKLWRRSLLIVTYCAGFNLQASADVAATEDVRIMARVQVLRPLSHLQLIKPFSLRKQMSLLTSRDIRD